MKHKVSVYASFLFAIVTASEITSSISSPTQICAELQVINFHDRWYISTSPHYFRVTVENYRLNFIIQRFGPDYMTINQTIYTCQNLHEHAENNSLSLQNPFLSAISSLNIEAIESTRNEFFVHIKLKLKLFLMSDSEEEDKISESRKTHYGINSSSFWLVGHPN